jgi:molybdopterin/thiamine biosynthesis adenylyltransferase/outer membrane protein assembly factor BamB
VSEEDVYARHRRHTGSVLVIGVGSVGSLLAEELARLGISPLGLVDLDVLETQNIVRHALGDPYLGQPKAPGLADKISREFPLCNVSGVQGDFLKLSEAKQLRLVSEFDLVVAATDSPACQRRINEICVRAQVTAVYPGIWTGAGTGDHDAEIGEILWVRQGGRTPCYLCATSWRTGGAGAEARGGTRADIMVLVLATVSVITALLEPSSERARLLNEEETLILIHGFMPASTAFQGFFDGRNMRSVEVPFPATPCPACGHMQPPAPSPPPGRPAASPPPRQPLSTSSSARVLVISVIAIALIGGIAWGVATVRHNQAAAAQAQAAGVAAEQAVWRAPAVLSDPARDVSSSTGGGHLYYSLSLAQDAGVIVESINASTGQPEWRYQSSGQTPPQNLAAPTLVGGLVIAHDDTSVFALYAKSGQLRWRISTSNGVSVSLGSRGYVVIWDKSPDRVSAYHLNTGTLAWTNDNYDAFNYIADISIVGRQLIVLRDTTQESWDLATGHKIWSTALEAHGNLADQGYAIGGFAYGRVIILRQSSIEAYNLSNGSLAWRVSMPMGQPQDLLVSSQAVLIVTCAQNCFGPAPLRTAYDPRSGRQLWQEAWSDSGVEPTRIHVAWLTSDTLIQWQNSPSNVWLVHARTGVIFWRRSFATIQPSSVTGDSHRLYLVDWSGAVLATAR